MKGLAALLLAGTGLALAGALLAVVYPVVKLGGRWYSWKRATAESSRIVANAHRKYRHAEGLLASATYRHGGHRIPLTIGAAAAGAAADLSALWNYDGEAAAILGTVDQSVECVKAAVLVFDAVVTGVVTNNFNVELQHRDKLGVLKNRVVYAFGNTVNAVAFVGLDMSGPAAGGLLVATGVAILGDGWKLAVGDTIVARRTSNGTGAASPSFTVTIKIGSLGS